MNDLRYALRSLRKQPGFVTAAVITLGLGIGATTAIFSVVNGVLLRPLPYPKSERLVRIWASRPDRNLPFFSVSPSDYRDWQEQATSFDALGAFDRQTGVALTGMGDPSEVLVSPVTPEVFDVLGTAPAIGRRVLPEDVLEGRPVVVASQAFWRQHFGSSPEAIGRSVTLAGVPHTVVGVMPAGFAVPGTPAALWIPLDLRHQTDRSRRILRVLGRLAPGKTIEGAVDELDAISSRLAEQYPASNRGWTVTVRSLPQMVVGDQTGRALVLLLGVVGMVLLIACANVANLLLVRATARSREFAIRAAIGASRGRMFRHAVAESLILGVLAGGVGLGLAYWGVEVLQALRPASLPRLDDIAVDGRVLAFTGVLALATGLMFGLVPAYQTPARELHNTLRSDTRVVGGRGAARARGGLVVAQIALAVLLLVGAALLARSLDRLQNLELGFEPDDVTTFQINLPEERYPTPASALLFFDRLREEVRALPGVRDAGLVSVVPHGGPNTGGLYLPEGALVMPGEAPDADIRYASGDYFRALGIPLVSGQSLPEAGSGQGVVVVNQALARRNWPGENPVSRRIRMGGEADGPLFTIVGVVGDVRYQSLETPDVRPMIYFSHRFEAPRSLTLVVRGTGSRQALVDGVRGRMATLDPEQPVAGVRAMDELVAGELSQRRFSTLMFTLFAALAVVLAAVGTYAVLSYTVTQQAREIGIRVALGAPRSRVVMRCVRHAALLAAAGVATGMLLAGGLARVLESLLYATSPTEPAAFLGVATALMLVALAAAYVPARRAARVDPMVALRYE